MKERTGFGTLFPDQIFYSMPQGAAFFAAA